MNQELSSKCLSRLLLVSALLLFAIGPSIASNVTLEGQNKGDTNNWNAVNLQNWQELDTIPCRVHWTSAQGNNQVIELNFQHVSNGGFPGIQNLFNFSTSSNVVFTSPPVLAAPPAANTWSYSFTINILDGQPA